MMNALEFIKGFRRMCEKVEDCSDCPLDDFNCGDILSMDSTKAISDTGLEQIIGLVEKWGREHPAKTYLTEIQKIFPYITANDCPGCLLNKNTQGYRCPDASCSVCRAQFWNTEI